MTDSGILSNLVQKVDGIEGKVVDLIEAIDTFYILSNGFLIFLMQAGFAVLTAGSVSVKNVKNAIMKNLFDACIGGLAFWLFGYAFAYGEGNSAARGFIGVGNFALNQHYTTYFEEGKNRLHDFFFQWTFAATAATIVSGSVAERTTFYAYLVIAFFLNAWVYPIVVHWVWSEYGFLRTLFGEKGGAIDFAGCIVVHIVGGFAGLVGAIRVGPRRDRFDENGNPLEIPPHSTPLASIGAFLLWFGWYGFNSGSTGQITDGRWQVAERCAVSTTIAASAGGLTTLVLAFLVDQVFDLHKCLNGVLAGLVSITACCAFIDPWAALVIAIIGAVLYFIASVVILKLQIDDPLDAFPIHGVVGIWGAIAGAIFNRKEYQEVAGFSTESYGLLYNGGSHLLLANGLGVICSVAWTVAHLFVLFFVMEKIKIKVRVSEDTEEQGYDRTAHNGPAYPYFQVNDRNPNIA